MKNSKKEIWDLEETKAWQRSSRPETHIYSILEGDMGTACFKGGRSLLFQIAPRARWNPTKDMLSVAVDFQKKLSGFEPKRPIHLSDSFWSVADLVSTEENASLVKEFSEDEIKASIFYSYAHGAPSLMVSPFFFYQSCRETIKSDFIALVRDFESGKLNVHRLNFCVLTLIPKEPGSKEVSFHQSL